MLRRIDEQNAVELKYTMLAQDIDNKRCFQTMPDNQVLFFGKGRIDDWCTWLGKPVWNGNTMTYDTVCAAVTDVYYYGMCKYLANQYGRDRIYSVIYYLGGQTEKSLNQQVLNYIQNIALSYGPETDDIETAYAALMMIYYGMVGEENFVSKSGKPTVAGKVIKLLGLYDYLIGNQSIDSACHCNDGVPAQDILQRAASVHIYRN